jgi:hypothetical protein
MPDASSTFQFGDCCYEVLRVVVKALEAGFRDFAVVEGMVYLNGEESAIPHTWIELRDGSVKDPTANQFGDAQIQYGPPGEFREDFTPEEYIEHSEFSYGVGPSDL